MSSICIHYHRDFDGMVSAGVLAAILRDTRGEDVTWQSVNYHQRDDWENFGRGTRFAIVDFHFHPEAEYWFDHHPTTFLSDELRASYQPNDKWAWDESSPSCPPLILRHAKEHWDYDAPERFVEMAHWSDIVDAAKYKDVEQAMFGDEPALRISRSLYVAPNSAWLDDLVGAMSNQNLDKIANRKDVEKAYGRAARNRDKALEQFPPTIINIENSVLLYDASSNSIRRERFAAFFHHPEIHYSVGVIPTRAGYHVSAGVNPWNPPIDGVHIGEIMEGYGGGGHRTVGGANPESLQAALDAAAEVAVVLRAAEAEAAKETPTSAGNEA
ncbi:MAG: oligoribonuclease NrnB/cAMP/cGMP phosphodiesterase (DHH superfamily) [Planctomycetota bacterium]|jgi:oligoribonuclease NrnB/cAMP/cGMP phosphodiesterase (DHH superfamily)